MDSKSGLGHLLSLNIIQRGSFLEKMRNRTGILAIGVLLIGLTFVGALPVEKAQGAPLQLSLAPTALSLSTIPPKLPADNNTYQAVLLSVVDKNGQPTAALTNIDALLISSQENVGTVTGSLTIPSGQTYAVANFTTTNTPGSTTVTATAPGLSSASTPVNTVVAVGYPTHLVAFAAPNTVPARASNTGKLILELQDDVGLPAKAISDTPITLYSSNTNVVSLTTPAAVMKQGSYLLEIDYASSFVPGSATITSSASGFGSGTATITVLGFPPLALRLLAQPAIMVACAPGVTSCVGRLVVALTDLSGNPARATRDIQVQIRSSDLAILNAFVTTTIKAGNIEATANYTVVVTSVGLTPYVATITASSPGLQSSIATVTILQPQTVSPSTCTSGPQTTCQLAIYSGPNPVLADHRSYSSVVVQLQANPPGVGLSPAINATGPTEITLTSSVTGIGNFTKITFIIPQGQDWAAVDFTSTFQVGVTELTASAQNMLPIQTPLATFGPVPSRVALQTISANLPADGESHPALVLSLQDAFGSPAIAPFDVPVNLTSSHSAIVRVAPVIIPAGQTYAVVNVTAGILQGSANVTALESAFTSGFESSSAVLTAVIPAPSSLASYIPAGGKIIWPKVGDQSLPLAAVQLQDAAGNPARARGPMNITVTSSNSTVIPKLLITSVSVGQDYVLLPISPAVPGLTTLTISAPGFSISTLPVAFLSYPSQETITGGPAKILTNQSAVISVSVTLDGSALPGASVHWSTSGGGLTIATPPSTNKSVAAVSTTSSSTSTRSTTTATPTGSPSVTDLTDKTGASIAIFRPNKAGEATISAAVSGPGVPTKTLNFTVLVTPPPPAVAKQGQGQSLTQQFTSFPYVLLPIGGAGGAIAAIFLIRRRGGGKGGGGDEDFDTSFE